MQPKKPPQKPARKGEYATPKTEPSARDRIEQLIESVRERGQKEEHATVPNGTGARKPLINDKTAITGHSMRDRIEELIDSIRGQRMMSKYAATVHVPVCIGTKISKRFTVQDARILLFSRCHYWSFTASSKSIEEKEKATRRRRVKTAKNRDDLKHYPWSVIPATVKVKKDNYAAVPVDLETVNDDPGILIRNGRYWGYSEASGSSSASGQSSSSSSSSSSAARISNTTDSVWKRSGRTDISRTPKIFPGFAIGCVPPKPAYYPLLPFPLTSCTGYTPELERE